jgi:hypothetical protein
MLFASLMGKSSHDKIGSGIFYSEAASHGSTTSPRQPRCIIFTWSCFLQLLHSSTNTKKPIFTDSIFSQPDKLQLPFCSMVHYAASTFTSHIKIPFNYSALLHLQSKMVGSMDTCISELDCFDFKLSD